MFHLNSSLLSGFVPWDTNYARKYLQVSEDQLEKINKIPGWSKSEISEKTTTENDKTSENIGKKLDQQTSIENVLTNTNISAKNDIFKNKNYNSNVQSKQNSVSPLNQKELFLKNVSLSPLRKKHTSANSLQRSSSLPNLCEKSLSAQVLPFSNSEESYRKQIHSVEKDISSFKLVPLFEKKNLNKTSTVSDDKLLKPNLKTVDDSIINHKYLKDVETSAIKSEAVLLFSNGTVGTALKQKMSLFEKKLLLLENRLSPSKQMSPPPFDSNIINLENLNREKNLKASPGPEQADEVTVVGCSDSVQNLPDEIENSSLSKNHIALESQANSLSTYEKSDAFKNTFESAKDKVGDASKTAACNFESFVSPPLPCGQPVPKEVTSPSQPIPSRKSAELSTPSKLQNASPPIPYGQPVPKEVPSLSPILLQKSAELITPTKLQNASPPVPYGPPVPTEVPPLSQPILSQKLAKLNTLCKSLNAEMTGKITAPEKPSDSFSVFSANLNEKVSDLTSCKELGTKRKRKSRSEKLSKKLDVKKLKTDIQFSSAQIKSMIEIMKIFHTEF